MRFLLINVVCGIRSTGRICTDIADALSAQGHEVKIAYGRETVPEKYHKYAIRIGDEFSTKIHGIKARLFDGAGMGSARETERFVEWVKEYDPDIIHLHNLHGYYLNIEVLFDYLHSCGKRIIWTLHDCWPFTGHCAYFDYAECDFWKSGCHDCPQKNEYPKSIIDRAEKNWHKKRKLFCGIDNLTIVTPSKWLANLVRESFLNEYDVQVVNNGVDTSVFHKSDGTKVRELVHHKKIVLGVAAVWDRRKGMSFMNELAAALSDDYQVVIIGVSEEQKKDISERIVSIPRTNSLQELVEWYSAAEIFVNPTLEDNYPTTNLEAIACGTPVVTFRTGGSPESAELFGCSIDVGDIDEVSRIIKTGEFSKVANVPTVADMVKQYVDVYRMEC